MVTPKNSGVPSSFSGRRHLEPNLDWGILSDLEGGQELVGYVPTHKGKVIGRSGLTIATGVDFGQRNMFELERAPLTADSRRAIAPFLGKTGEEARRLLETLPPVIISRAEAQALDRHTRQGVFRRLRDRYSQDVSVPSSDERDLARLSREVQTVIVSVAWQHGSELYAATPVFWRAAADQRWCAVYDELMNFGDEFGARRRREAGYLKRWLEREGREQPSG